MKFFVIFQAVLQIIQVCLCASRAFVDNYGWSWLVFILNLFNFIVISIDATHFGYSNPLFLFLLLCSECFTLGALLLFILNFVSVHPG